MTSRARSTGSEQVPKHIAAALGQGQIGFYTAATTAIPVLMLTYLVEMAAFATRVAERVDQFAEKGEDAFQRASSSDTVRISELLSAAVMALILSTLSRVVRNGLIVPALLAAAGLPTAGEVCALAALAEDRSNHAFLVVTWLGVAVSLIIVLSPVVYAVAILYRPGPPLAEALHAISEAHRIRRRSFEDEGRTPDYMSEEDATGAGEGTSPPRFTPPR
jgi:hypothetical protein